MAAFDFSIAAEPMDTIEQERIYNTWRRRATLLVGVNFVACLFALAAANVMVEQPDTYLTTYGGQLIPVTPRSR
jgi:hypothetical protein